VWRFRTIGRVVSITGGHLGNISPYSVYKRIRFDSRMVKEGDLFVALKGEHTDGHLYVEEALKKGAIAALVGEEYFFRYYHAQPLIGVRDTLKALWELASARMQMEGDSDTIAVVGSVGKTTTKELISHILSGIYTLYRTPGNFNTLISVPSEIINMPLGIPMSVFELALHEVGDVDILASIVKPKILVITAIAAEHLEYLGSLSTVKKENLKALRHVRTNGWVIIPGSLYKDVKDYTYVHSDQIITFGRKGHVDISARSITVDWSGTTFTINAFGESKKVHIPLHGVHYVFDVMAAVAVGFIYDMTLSYIAARLEEFSPVWGRMQVYDVGDKKIVFDAYNASPASMKYFIHTLDKLVKDKDSLLVFIGDMKELGRHSRKYHEELAELLSSLSPAKIVLVGNEVRATYDKLVNGGFRDVELYESVDDIVDGVDAMMERYSIVAFKGSRSIHLERLLKVVGLVEDEPA